jgi:hypothetical protein
VGKVAHQPEQHSLGLSRRGHRKQKRDQRGEAGGEHDSSQQQPIEVPVARTKTDRQHQPDREQRATQRGDALAARGESEQHRGERAHCRPAGDAENIGIGERVPQQDLEQRAGERKQRSAGKGGQHSRRPQLHDHVVSERGRSSKNRFDCFAGGNMNASGHEPEPEARRSQDKEQQKEERSRHASCVPRSAAP